MPRPIRDGEWCIADRAQEAGGGKGNEHKGADPGPGEHDDARCEVPHRHLDEEVRDAPDDAHGAEQQPSAAAHLPSSPCRLSLSECPRSRPGATRSRTACLSRGRSGNPCRLRSHTVSPSTRTTNTPPVPGTRATSPSSRSKVVSSSWATQAARR